MPTYPSGLQIRCTATAFVRGGLMDVAVVNIQTLISLGAALQRRF
ncbi:MAG: hypothetical protein ACR2P2_08865 [Nakamurella sp.]